MCKHTLVALLVLSGAFSIAKPPNIVFVFSDDHATQALSCYGGPLADLAPTPHQVNYSYESVTGRLATVSPASDWSVTYAYQPTTGLQSGYAHQSNHTPFLTQEKIFDAAGRLESISQRSGSNSVLNRYAYQLDSFGQRKQ